VVTNGLDGLAKIFYWSIWSEPPDQIDQTIKITAPSAELIVAEGQ
jgi:hypothetical protein